MKKIPKSNFHSKSKTKLNNLPKIKSTPISTSSPKFSIISFLSWSMTKMNSTLIPPKKKINPIVIHPHHKANTMLKMKINMILSHLVYELSLKKPITPLTLFQPDIHHNNLQNLISTSIPHKDNPLEIKNPSVLKKVPFIR